MNKKGTIVYTPTPEQEAALRAFIEGQEVPPTRAAVVKTALNRFLNEQREKPSSE